jgi:hypothetical protein
MENRQRRRVSSRTVAHLIAIGLSWVAAVALWATVHDRKFDGPTETVATLLGLWTAAVGVALWLGREHRTTRGQLRLVEGKVDDLAADNVFPIRPEVTQVLPVVTARAPVPRGAVRRSDPPRLAYSAGDHTIDCYVRDVLADETG